MKIDNPPSPPFRKGGLGGFEGYFLRKFSTISLPFAKAFSNSYINILIGIDP